MKQEQRQGLRDLDVCTSILALYRKIGNSSKTNSFIFFLYTCNSGSMKVFRFKSIRYKPHVPHPNKPDYDNIIELNGKFFTLTGWLDMGSNIDWKLQQITDERLKGNKYLQRDLIEFKLKRGKTRK